MADEVLGRIAIEMDLKDSKFRTNLQGTNKAVRNAMSEMKANMAVVSQAGSKYDILATKQRGLNRVIEAQKNQLQALKNQYEGSITKSGEWTNATANYAKKYNDASAKVAQLNKQLVANAQQMEIVRTKTMGLTGKLNSFGEGAVKAGERLTGIGKTMTGRVTTPIVAGFTYAAKSAIDFNSQIQAMGPLLTNGGTVTAKYKAQLEQLSASSMKWSKQYGVSTTSINEGMSEMIKRGYTAQQTLGAMPSVLNAAKASGDDFNTVMSVSTATLEQFGLKVDSTSGMLKNTQRVTDTLTYVSNATAAGFQDLGEAMTYVGPTAHSANISLEQTAAALGIMSNRGIEGSVAGTALRGALTRLMKPSKQNAAAFKEMGINVEDFKKGTLTLPGIIDKIKKNTAGWTDEQRASAIATAFGTEAQAGMNALIAAGGDELREYTEGAKKASGTTKKIADQLNNTEKAKLERFKQSVHVLAIEIGQKLLPALTPTIEKASDWIDAFSKMDSSTQQMIVKTGLFAAAIGPMSMLIGGILKPLGMLTQGTVKTIGFFRAWKAGASVLQSVSASTGIATSAFQIGSGAVGKFGAKAAASKASLALLGESAGSAGMAINLLNPYVLGTVAAVGLGVAAWKLWGEKAYESAERTKKWGSDIGADADQAATKFKNYSTEASVALDDTATKAEDNADRINKAFDGMVKSVEESTKKQKKQVEDFADSIGGAAADAIRKAAKKDEDANDEHLKKIKKYQKQVNDITKEAKDKNVALTQEQRDQIANIQTKMAEEQVKTLGLGAKKQRLVLKAELNQTNKMTQDQLKEMTDATSDAMYKEMESYNDKYGKIKRSSVLTTKEKNAALEALEKEHMGTMTKLSEGFISAEKARGYKKSAIIRDLQEVTGLETKKLEKIYDDFEKRQKDTQSSVVKINGDMKKSVRDAADSWNNLILDPKTGKLKTNAQEEVTKAVGSEKQWNNIRLLLKEGKLTTNAKKMVAEAVLQNNKWDSLSWKEKKALIKSKGNQELAEMIEDGKQWNSLSIETKKAIVNAKGKKEVVDSLFKMGEWNKLDPKEQYLLIHDKASAKIIDSLQSLGLWNKLDAKTQKLAVNGDTNALKNALLEVDQWNKLSLKEQKALIDDKATTKFYDLFRKTDQWNNLNLQQKEAILNSKGTKELVNSLQQAGIWNSLSLKELEAIFGVKGKDEVNVALLQGDKWNDLSLKDQVARILSKGGQELFQLYTNAGKWNDLSVEAKQAIVNAKGNGELQQAITDYSLWQGMPAEALKNIVTQDNASGNIDLAMQALEKWQQANPGQEKVLESMDLASGPLQAATSAVNQYKNTPVGPTKVASGQDWASGPISRAKGSVDNYRNTSTGPAKKGIAVDMASSAMGQASRSVTGFRNTSPGGTKNAKAVDNASGPANAASRAVEGFSAKKDHTITLTTVTKFITEMFTKRAKGTNYHPGGLMMVNDQPGPVFRELVQFPSGETFIPHGRNVMLDAPRGSKVLTASKTARKFPGIRQYASGTQIEPKLTSNMRYLSVQPLTDQSQGSTLVGGKAQDLSKLESKFDTMISLLQALLQKPSDVLMNGQKVGELVASEVANQQVTDINLESRGVYSGR